VHPEDDSLYVLLDRYLTGELSAAEAELVRQWLADDPEHARLLDDLRLITRVTNERVPESSVDAAWAKAARDLELAPARKPLLWRRLRVTALAAAAVFIALIGGRALRRQAPPLREVATAAAHRAVVRLRDGTQVTLAPESRLRYAPDYGRAHRDVYLDGEAYFQVTRDERLPFRVRTAATVTEDLGTAFVIRAYADQITTEVVVAEGRVALWRAILDTIAVSHNRIARPDAPPALVLGARELGRLEANGTATRQRGVNVARQLAWTSGVLAFDGTPLGEAVGTLERWYDVEIRLEDADSALAARRLTATFQHEPIDLVMKRIALTLGMRVERGNGSVFLLRNGS
jgi:ferric-dicitrate binding protein FerR (iron transport regulator)